MSWLRNHMRHFVLPGIHTISRANGKTLHASDIKPSDREVRPAAVCEYPEAGMLYAVCASILRKSDPVREVALDLCRHIGKPGDAKFIYELDSQKRVKELAEGYEGVEGADVLHSFVLNSVKSLKRKTHRQGTVIYPGRDVWCWEVLSRKLGQPSVFDSRVSRDIAENEVVLKKTMADWNVPDWNKTILFDSGYAGTVPRAIGKAAGLQNMNVLMLSAVKSDEQIFPKHTKSRQKALACEYLAKYQKRSVVRNGAAYQELADLKEFIKAALLTIWLWHHVSPAKLPSWKDQPPKPSIAYGKYSPLRINSGFNSNVYIPAIGPSTANYVIQSPTTSVIQVANNWNVAWNSSTAGASITGGGFYLDNMWGTGSSVSTLPLIDPNTMQLVPAPQQPSPSPTPSTPGGPAAGKAVLTTSAPSIYSTHVPLVLDGNGKPICI